MKANLRRPCNECPFRRVAPPGWLGGYRPDEFTNQIQFDGPPLPCHKSFKRSEPKSMCAGALIFMKNQHKSAQHPDYGDALDRVEADTVNVFQWPAEFLEYHRDPDGWMKRAAKKG